MSRPDSGEGLDTARLRLRRWREQDRAPFAEMNRDPLVMEHLPSTLTREGSDAFVDRIIASFETNGFGQWAVERLDTGAFIGFVGLSLQTFPAHFTPAVEVGWRLARQHWGQGFATEAARASVEHGFDVLGLEEIVSMTVPANARSRRVMERIGMTHDADDDFDHPRFPEGHGLRRHVLYRLRRDA